MSDTSEVRPVTDVAGMRACQEVQRKAWNITQDGYTLPVATMVAVQKYGGLVLGAWQGATLVGFSFAFLGWLHDQHILYSQLTAVLPGVQGGGVGYRLKTAQREWARVQGLPFIVWAFDPMQAGNAHFNIARLGATCRSYETDMYGERADAINTGFATDRLIAEWPTDGVVEVAGLLPRAVCRPLLHVAARADGIRHVIGYEPPAPDETAPLCLEIPENVVALAAHDREIAAKWQHAARQAFLAAFVAGYRVTGFMREEQAGGGRHCQYLLTKAVSI